MTTYKEKKKQSIRINNDVGLSRQRCQHGHYKHTQRIKESYIQGSTITKIKILLDGHNSRFKMAKESRNLMLDQWK